MADRGDKSWQTHPAKLSSTSFCSPQKVATGRIRSDLLAVLALIVSVISLGVSITQGLIASKSARIDRANSAIQHFLASSDTRSIADAIARETQQGTNYSKVISNPTLKGNINHYLNELEIIAEGTNEGRYDEETVFNNLAVIIFKQVKAHLNGEPGTIPSGQSWLTNEKHEPNIPFKRSVPRAPQAISQMVSEQCIFRQNLTPRSTRTFGSLRNHRSVNVIHKNLLNCAGILSTSRSSPAPSVTAASPGLSQNCTTTSPRTATRSSQGASS